MDTLQYKDIFISESMEHLDFLNQMLLTLEKNPADKHCLNEIFRTVHTLKGMAATMGFDQITELTHKMENVFDQFRSQDEVLAENVMDVLFQCLDMLSLLVDEISSSEPKNLDVGPLIGKLKTLERPAAGSKGKSPAAKGDAAASKMPVPAEVSVDHLEQILRNSQAEGFTTYGIRARVEENCTFKGVRAFMVFKVVSEHGEVIATQPEAQALQEGQFERDFALVLLSKKEPEVLKKSIHSVAEIEFYEVIELQPQDVESFCGANMALIQTAAPVAQEKTREQGKAEGVQGRAVQSIRVSIERLDNLQNLVGELVINKIRLSQISKQYNLKDLKEALAHFDRVTNELQDEVTEVRMVPMEHIFNRFRMVRDLAKEGHKELDLVMEGKEIELDRTVLDEINDPLVHLLRNAVDHGIEPPEERVRNGKNQQGSIRLSASREKNHVIIKVEDDGRGIDPEAIRRVALEHGLFSRKISNI